MKLDHCLFGYDDGHRLIASSLPLGEESGHLTIVSDLAPGIVFGNSKGYWTGFPMPSIGRYVLMYTWPAPEMPRPGCVWTHALLLEPAMLESIEDLSILQEFITRPKEPLDKDYYRKPLKIDINKKNVAYESLDVDLTKKLIGLLYEKVGNMIEVSASDILDLPLFAVWSQQWPRLRRNFRFQTAISRVPKITGSANFDVIAVYSQDKFTNSDVKNISANWLNDAVKDILDKSNSSLRTFLWEYGRDVRKQRGSFKPLSEIHALRDEIKAYSIQSIIDIIIESFPVLNDAQHLKQDLIDGVFSKNNQLMLITKLILNTNEIEVLFPVISRVGIDNLIDFWPSQSESIFDLLVLSSNSSSDSGKIIFENLVKAVQTPDFWTLSDSHPIVRKIIVERNPEFLLANEAILDNVELTGLLALVPFNSESLTQFISNAIMRDDKNVANTIFTNFPNIAATQVIQKLNVKELVPAAWKSEFLSLHDYLLKDEIISTVAHSSLLYEIANTLGWLSATVIIEGITPWYNSLMSIINDLDETKADTLNCFFIVLATKSIGKKEFHVVECLFANLHNKILKSKLSDEAKEILLPHLPEVRLLWSWDLGYRFRLAIAKAYLNNKWPVESYISLASDRKDRALLVDAAINIEGGREYFHDIRSD